jgi:hypothetical protein
MGEGTIDITPGRIVQLPLPENKIEAVNLQSDVANSREFAGDLRGEAEELSGVPMIASGRTAYMPRVCYELLRKWVRGKGVQTSRTAHATDWANLW